ncbi:MAG: Asp23/Gls24 family envelope stress response protein [Bacteroides sp.]|nr:Asp23/Gls24 family envelope stress response protein [Eubacterium sp.]MCM1419072.1 Asp23/Gls24 family envelope stress response protein [Roseburia sp.]MCM1461741.1 Asp23/Gls24 family envelope stress response protein [Bacteroides sp.]
MLIVQNHCGGIRYSKEFFDTLVSETVTSCFGVAALNAANRAEALFSRVPLVKKLYGAGKGVSVDIGRGKIQISLHISVVYGTNAAAVTDSIRHKLQFVVEEQTGLPVERISVYIDDLIN